MSRLDDLLKKRSDLDREISALEKSQVEFLKAARLQSAYTKVACASCDGSGSTFRMGADNTDMDEDGCEDCGGKGFLYARNWERNTTHDMDYNEVFPA